MLATGGTRVGRAIPGQGGADHITCICLIAAPEGIARLNQLLDELRVPCTLVLAGLDEKLNDVGYILPGLGDAGDRLQESFNTDLSVSVVATTCADMSVM